MTQCIKYSRKDGNRMNGIFAIANEPARSAQLVRKVLAKHSNP